MTLSLDLEQLIIFGLLTSSLHWLVARAEITRWLWSRAPGPLDALLRCPACSGFWLGAGVAALGVRPVGAQALWLTTLLGALVSTFVTPVFEAVLLWGLERTAIEAAPLSPPIRYAWYRGDDGSCWKCRRRSVDPGQQSACPFCGYEGSAEPPVGADLDPDDTVTPMDRPVDPIAR